MPTSQKLSSLRWLSLAVAMVVFTVVELKLFRKDSAQTTSERPTALAAEARDLPKDWSRIAF